MTAKKKPAKLEVLPDIRKGPTKARARAKEADDKLDLWHRAWFLSELGGMGQAAIGDVLEISGPTAGSYVKKWKALIAGSVDHADERKHQMEALTELETRLWREGMSGKKSWADVTGPLRGVLSDRRDLVGGFESSGKQVSVEFGLVAGDAGAPSVRAALRLVTGADDTKAG